MVGKSALVLLGVASVTLVGAGIALAMREKAKNGGNGEVALPPPLNENVLLLNTQTIDFIESQDGTAQIPVSAVIENLTDISIKDIEVRMDVIENGSFGVISLGKILLLPNVGSLAATESKVASAIKKIDVLSGATYRAVVFVTIGAVVADQQEFELLS